MEDARTSAFASTQWSIVLAGADRDQPAFREAFGALVVRYRPAIVAFVRAYYGCDKSEAEDITQSFLTRWAENGMSGVSRDRSRFRSYLRCATRHFVRNWRRSREAHKRGGDRTITSLQGGDGAWEIEDPSVPTPDEAFDAVYRQELFSAALAVMGNQYQEEGRAQYMELFQRPLRAVGRK